MRKRLCLAGSLAGILLGFAMPADALAGVTVPVYGFLQEILMCM
jgi:hypothetical protein